MLLMLMSLALAHEAPRALTELPDLPTSGTFETAKGQVTPAGEDTLRPWVDALLANPGWAFELSAHTDSMGSGSYNQTLSQRRAEGAVAALVEAGVNPAQLVARGYGEERPIASNDSKEGQARNRRLELTVIGPLEDAAAPSAAGPTSAAAYTGPSEWVGFSPELKGELRSGDEQREGKLQVDTVSIDLPVSDTYGLYFFHARDNQPTGTLLGPEGQRVVLTPGEGSAALSQGRWTLRVQDHKRAEGTWGLRMNGAGPSEPPGPGAPTCAVLNYLMAQTHVDLRDARGPAIDDNFDTLLVQLPGLPGQAVVHHTDEVWQELYAGPDAQAAQDAFDLAGLALAGCLASGWQAQDSGWNTMSFKFAPDTTWEQRTVEITQPTSDRMMLVKLQIERREDSAEANLYIYQTDAK